MPKKKRRRAPRRTTPSRPTPAPKAAPAGGLRLSVARKLMDRQQAEWDLLMERQELWATNAALRAKNDALQAAVIEATTRRRHRKPADAPALSGRPRGRPRVLTDAVVRELLRQTSGRKLSVGRLVDRLKDQGIIVDRTTLQKALKKARAQS